jgi:hypothetical protein
MTSLRYQGENVSSYDNLEHRVTGVSVLYYVSDAQTLSQQWVIHAVVGSTINLFFYLLSIFLKHRLVGK